MTLTQTEPKTGVVYKITNRLNGMAYIGWTTNLKQRLSAHKSKARHGSKLPLHVAITDLGFDAFDVTVLVEVPISDLNQAEVEQIKKHGTQRYGYNQAIGGPGAKGTKASPETRAKQRTAHEGPKNHFFGRSHSEESRQKIARAKKGTSGWSKGLSTGPNGPGTGGFNARTVCGCGREITNPNLARHQNACPTFQKGGQA